MKFEGTKVWGFENALIGMRLPMCNSYEEAKNKLDSTFYKDGTPLNIGSNDMRVALARIKADDVEGKTGQPEAKFLRQIHVQVCITAPVYWWKEMDTYKVATVRNSSSQMHKLASTPITMDCFEMDDYSDLDFIEVDNKVMGSHKLIWNQLISYLELLRMKYNELIEQSKKLNEDASKVKDIDKGLYEHLNLEAKKARKQATKYWKELVRLLPQSWLQTSVWDANYETLRNIASWRSSHKLNEWSGKDNPEVDYFLKWVQTLPYANEFILPYEPKPLTMKEQYEEASIRG